MYLKYYKTLLYYKLKNLWKKFNHPFFTNNKKTAFNSPEFMRPQNHNHYQGVFTY